jgi:hypothetical protein
MDACELTVGQEALWFLQQLAPDSSAYNTSGAINLHFAVDVDVLAAAVRRTVSAHRILNSVFRSVGGEVRRCPSGIEAALEVHELAANDEDVRKFALDFAQRPFQLDRQLPVRFSLLRRPESPDILVMAAHHIVVDNISQLLVLREILTEYAALATGTTRAIEDKSAGFDEFVRGQRKYVTSRRAEAARAYWRGELADFPTGDLPTDLTRPDRYVFAGSEIDFELSPDVLKAVTAAAADRNTTVFAYLFSAFQLLLSVHGGQTDFVVGYPVTLRMSRQMRDSIGYFVNTLPFRAQVDPDESFAELLDRTGKKLWRGSMHREYPYAMMPRLLDAPREPNRAGLISTMFVITDGDPDDPFSAVREPGRRTEYAGLSISEFYLPQQQGQFDITVQVHAASARAQIKYNTSLFTEETARGLADKYNALLRSSLVVTVTESLETKAKS